MSAICHEERSPPDVDQSLREMVAKSCLAGFRACVAFDPGRGQNRGAAKSPQIMALDGSARMFSILS